MTSYLWTSEGLGFRAFRGQAAPAVPGLSVNVCSAGGPDGPLCTHASSERPTTPASKQFPGVSSVTGSGRSLPVQQQWGRLRGRHLCSHGSDGMMEQWLHHVTGAAAG